MAQYMQETCLLFGWMAMLISGAASGLAGETSGAESGPCGALPGAGAPALAALAFRGAHPERVTTHGLTLSERGTIVYDYNQGVCWLADANLAGDPAIQATLGVSGINPNGTMNWATALSFVGALNAYDGGRGYLGHNNWQLPDTPLDDSTCSSFNNGGFGASCTDSALGNLYYVGLGENFPNSVAPNFSDVVGPFLNLHPSLYWTLDQNSGGEVTFSFDTGLSGANTTRYNYFRVLPMTANAIGTPPSGSGVVPYTNGSAAGKAVYDTHTGITWPLDADLAGLFSFGLEGTTTISSPLTPPGPTLTVPLVDSDGAMLYTTADGAGGWLAAMNASNYAGSNQWALPHDSDLEKLFQDLGLQPGDRRMLSGGRNGPFRNLQPFFYWACERDQPGNSQSPCDLNINPGPPGMEYSFNFDNGFEGTDQDTKEFYVTVYFPARQ